MKKVLMTIVCVIVAIVAFAQTQSSSEETTSAPAVISVEVQDNENLLVTVDSVTATVPVTTADPVNYDIPTLVRVPDGGSEFILYKGAAYGVSESIPNGFFESFNHTREDNIEKARLREVSKVRALAVAFVVPCFTIVVALICFLVFWFKRSNSKNAIIAKAIEAGYDLPDAFYTGQSSQSSVYLDSNVGNNSNTDSGQTSRSPFTPVSVGSRDPKMFTSSVTLIAVGLSLLLFFGATANMGVGFLCGGIPLFLGIGRLIAYLYIPGARASRSRNGRPMPPPPHYGAPQHPNYSPRNFDNACPPPTPGYEMKDNQQPLG